MYDIFIYSPPIHFASERESPTNAYTSVNPDSSFCFFLSPNKSFRWRKLLANLALNVKKVTCRQVTLKELQCNRWFKSHCKNDNLTLADVINKSDSYQECTTRQIGKTPIVTCKSSKLLIPQWKIMKFIRDT